MLIALTSAAVLLGVFSLFSMAGGDHPTVRTRVGTSPAIPVVSDNDLAWSALAEAQGMTREGGTPPELALARDFTATGLLGMGTCSPVDADDPRYKLVVVRGDFDLADAPGMGKLSEEAARFQFLASIYDADEGNVAPAQMVTSRNGGSFRHILRNPNLPDDVPPGAPAGSTQADLSLQPDECAEPLNQEAGPEDAAPTAAPGQ